MASDPRRDLLAPSPLPAAGESDRSVDVTVRAAANAAVIREPTGASRPLPNLLPPSRPPPSSAGTSSTPSLPPADSIAGAAKVGPKKKTAKKFMSLAVTMAIKSPGIKMMLSPILGSPSATRNSPKLSSPNNKRPSSSSRPLHKNKRRKLKSGIWTDFEPIYDGQTLVEAQCIHCNRIFKVDRTVGTSACLRHMTSCDGKTRLDQMINQLKNTSSSDDSFKDWRFDQEKARDELVKLIVQHALPFSLVEYPKFRSFVASLNPWFKPISRITIRSYCMDSFEEAKAVLRDSLSGYKYRVSLTADLWTSNQTLGYLCVTLHCIDDKWTLFKRIIKFSLVETPHDGKAMFNAMLDTLHEWGLEDKLFSITLDNSTVNDSFVKNLRDNLVSKGLLFRKGKLFHCRCAAHVLNLVVQEGLSVISSAVSKIRDSVKYVKSSQSRKERFEKMVKKAGISSKKRPPLDIVTRWNSTFCMLDAAYQYKRAFESLGREDSQYVNEPIDEEWKLSKKICEILETFCSATKVVSGSNYPTSSCYFHQYWEVKKLLEGESSNSDPKIALMVHKMKVKLQKYWDSCFLQICIPVILDPRFKLSFIEFRLRQGFRSSAFTYFSKVKKTFQKLYDDYSLQFSGFIPKNGHTVNDELDVDESSPWADWRVHQNAKQTIRVSELDQYLEEETFPLGGDFDILQYWKTYSAKYPIVSSIARDVLAIPASSVPSESAFSSAKKTISDYRSRLASETVEALICLQSWLRETDSTLDDIAGNIAGDEDDDDGIVTDATP